MEASQTRDQWIRDGRVLAEIGAALDSQPTLISVRIPKALAERALAAWQRDDEPTNDLSSDIETCEERMVRHRAGSLALIGATLESSGVPLDDYVQVDLSAWFIGDALRAADDADLLQ